MFSGIIKEVVKVEKTEHRGGSVLLKIEKTKIKRFPPEADQPWAGKDSKIVNGDSMAVNGVCLTVAQVNAKSFSVELMPETLARTSFGKVIPAQVNIEPALRLADRLDGHMVLGHVDTVGKIKKITPRGRSQIFTVSFSARYSYLVVEKGSITLDGVSLTVVDVGKNFCSVSLVDYTLQHTNFGQKKVGDLVNIEFDIIGKYVAKMLSGKK